MNIPQKIREWGGPVSFLLIAALIVFGLSFNASNAEEQSRGVIADIKKDIVAHEQAQSARSCAATQLLAYIIFNGNARAHENQTGRSTYLRPKEKNQIHEYVRLACADGRGGS